MLRAVERHGAVDVVVQCRGVRPVAADRQHRRLRCQRPLSAGQARRRALFSVHTVARQAARLVDRLTLQVAALDGPVQPKALTRFRLPWVWNGEEAVLQSRAVDDAGKSP